MVKIEYFKDKKKEWRFRIKAKNGKILASSEGYKRVSGAEKAVGLILDSNIVKVVYIDK